MKIIFILPGIPGVVTGGSKVVFEYCNRLVSYGHEIEIQYYHEPKYTNRFLRKIWMMNLFIKAKFVEPKWFKLDKRVKKRVIYNEPIILSSADIIVATAIETVKIVRKAKKCKKIYFIQDFENWNYSNDEVYATYNLGMTNVVVAKWLKNIVDSYSKSSSYLVSNCIDTNIFYSKGLKRRKHSIVFHYRTAKYKGSKYALQVIRKLEKKYDDLEVDVISIEDKPKDLPSCCVYHQSIEPREVAEINNKTQVFMCTTIEEGFGLPGLEAMACGCAVVSTSYKGVLEYAEDKKNALLSPIKNVDIMVNNIVTLFENDEMRKEVSENGVQTGKQRSIDKSAKMFEEILMQCKK